MGLLVLVTGAAGKLGQRVCHELLRQGHRVRATDVPQADFSGLQDAKGLETATGDIRDPTFVGQAVEGCEWVLHLAAILPPVSEVDRDRTLAINLGGTQNLLAALEAAGGKAPLVFTSSVATYGNTSDETPPVAVEHALRPLDIYGESKVMGESLLQNQGYPSTILRVGGIAVPAFLELPEAWPFSAQQRLEFINRDDVALALAHCVGNQAVLGRTFNIAGGASWQLHGCEYARGHYEAYEVPLDDAVFAMRPGPYDWYDTVAAQRMLDYQRTSYAAFVTLLDQAVKQALA